VFQYNFVLKIDFWMQSLGWIKNLSVVLKRGSLLLCVNLENICIPNLTFLHEQLGLPICQIVRLIKWAPFLLATSPQALAAKAKRAEELGCSSWMFLYALIIVDNLSQ
jgi:uncharacterized membrane protein YhaH (DUF805 family)